MTGISQGRWECHFDGLENLYWRFAVDVEAVARVFPESLTQILPSSVFFLIYVPGDSTNMTVLDTDKGSGFQDKLSLALSTRN